MRYKSLYYVVFISFLILKMVVSWVESVKIPASKMAAIKQSPELEFLKSLWGLGTEEE